MRPSRTARTLPRVGDLRLRAYDWLRGSPGGLVALAVIVGTGAGLGAVAFRYLISLFTEVFTGTKDYSDAGRIANPHLPQLGFVFVALAPVVGGLIYGPLVDRFAREARGHGVPEVMYAVAERGGRIRPQVTVVKAVASALCIGSGGSVGREGPIVQVGSALGSTIGQFVRLPESRLRLLVACGAAGGISATFNAPLAGVFFGLEVILASFETQSFGVVVLASVAAAAIGRAFFGNHPFLHLPGFRLTSPAEFLCYAVLGVLAAVAGTGFIRVLYGLEDVVDRLWRFPEWLRPAAGGVALGALLLAMPQLYGVGYPVLESAIRGNYVLWFLLLLVLGKLIATSLTLAIGGSGGVFAPSLFMGGTLGMAFGLAAHALIPGVAGSPGAYGLVGMGAVFAGAARAPITAVLIIFELTGDYSIILPLMVAIALSTGVSRMLNADTVYTLKLIRRGVDVSRSRQPRLMASLTVRDALTSLPAAVTADTELSAVIERFAADHRDALPVVDAAGAYRGTVSTREIEESAHDNAVDVTAGDLAVEVPVLRPHDTLEHALGLLVQHPHGGLPVVSEAGNQVAGWLDHRDVLRAYHAKTSGTRGDGARTVLSRTTAAPVGDRLRLRRGPNTRRGSAMDDKPGEIRDRAG